MPDPVISLIKSDRIAYRRAEDSCDGVAEGNPPPAAVAEYDAAQAASDESADRLSRTLPSTQKGADVYAKHIEWRFRSRDQQNAIWLALARHSLDIGLQRAAAEATVSA
jgi:hypothetical protein